YQANPKESHLVAVKRIFKYLKGTLNLGLWYPKGSGFDIKSAKKQSSVAMSSAEAKNVAAAGCCAQVLWIKSQLADYDVLYDKVPIFCDNTSAISISNNLVLHSKTKHIDIRYHFIRDHILKGEIELHFVPTDLQLADIFTKPLAEPSFTILVVELGMLNIKKQVSDKKQVNFKCEEGTIDLNNAIALLEHSNKLYQPMISFLSNCYINKALILQPSVMYVEYLQEFWYTTEVEKEMNTITFLLSWCDEPLSFTQKEFTSAIGLPIGKNPVPLPPKEIGSHDQMNLNQQTITYCLIYGLEIDIGGIIFLDLVHKLQNGKKHRELNIFYTRFLSMVFEKLLRDKYISNDLTLVKPHTIITASFQKPLASEVPLTLHMLKVAKLSEGLE
ncbi:hypothetical protein Tco_0639847, partial [Tanacetum coccineum]